METLEPKHGIPRSISFGGCGFIGVYHIGVLKCIQERVRSLMDWLQDFYGTSAGAVMATYAACKIDAMLAYKSVKKTFEASREHGPLGFLHPSFDVYARLRAFLEESLPTDAHRLSRGKLHISLSDLSSMQNRLVSSFTTRKELINVSLIIGACTLVPFRLVLSHVQALVASSFIPGYAGLKDFPFVRGKV